MKIILASLIGLFFIQPARAYETSWDGNHPLAKSEAWTWMGHLRELDQQGGKPVLGREGVGFIYYYTRNETPSFGAMNFRSSALTKTVDGVGQSFSNNTIYQAEHSGSEMRAREGRLELQFRAGNMADHVWADAMKASDLAQLNALLPLFPGLKVAAGFTPKKVRFQTTEPDGTRFDLSFYSIWPAVSPPGGRMRFLGQDGTSTFSEPMLVTVGTRNGRAVAGLSFLDRQWATDYFGAKAQNGLQDLLKYGHALLFAHGWSAFHVFNPTRNEWSFFHLWHQYSREDGAADRLADYSDLMWTNGTQSGSVRAADYRWVASGFVQQGDARVLLDYPMGRPGFFPSRANFDVPGLKLKAEVRGQPALQSLDQPIPFYEGYAAGTGTWDGDKVQIQGRLESSRLMFRDQDYREMLKTLVAQTDPNWSQRSLQKWLRDVIAQDSQGDPFSWITHPLAILASLLGDLDLKLAVFGDIMSHEDPARDPADTAVTIYR